MRRFDSLRRHRLSRLRLEALEDRTLLSVGLNPDDFNRNATAGLAGNQVETTIAVNPNNANQIFAASNPMIWRFSNDGGLTWNNSTTAGLPAGCCHNQASWDRHGNLFVTYLNAASTFVEVVRSVNGGANWSLIGNFPGTDLDQPSIDTGPGAASSGFSDAVCVSYRETSFADHIGARCAGINGFNLPVVPAFTLYQRAPGSNSGDFGDIAVTQGGQVLVTYQTPIAGAGPSTIRVNTDANGLLLAGGFNAGVNATATNVGGTAPIPAQPNNPIDAVASLDCDHFFGVCYLVYVDRPAVASNDTDIFLRKSFDNGLTWDPRLRVNDDVTANSQFHPAVDIDQVTGDVGVTWLDARNAGAANNFVQVWGTVQYFGNNWFWPNYRVSNGASNCVIAGGLNCGDYDTGAFHDGRIYRSWADNSIPSALTPANANNPANSQDLAMSRMLVDNADVGGTVAAALATGVGPFPTTFFHIDEPIGNDNNGDHGGRGRRDVDMYRIQANAGTTVTIRTSNPSGGTAMDTILRLFDLGGVQIASNDDDELGTDAYSRFTFTFAVGGTFFVGVSGFDNGAYDPIVYGSGVDGWIGDYHLDISLTAQADVGDTLATARITNVGPAAGSFLQAAEVIGNGPQDRRDVDFYRFTANAGQTVTVRTSLPAGGDSGNTFIRLFNAAGVQLAFNDQDPAGGTNYSLLTFTVPAAGNFFVGISAVANFVYNPNVAGSGVLANERFSLGDYRLSIHLTNQADVPDTLAMALVTGMGPGQGSFVMPLEVLGNGPFSTRDVDMYRFTANVGLRLTATTSLPLLANNLADTVIRLFNSAGVQIASNDQCGLSSYSCLNNFRIPATGTYTLAVSGFDNSLYNPNVGGSGVPGSVGDYRLSLSLAPGPVASFLVTQSAATTVAGTPFSVTVRARDDGGNTVTNYTGTVTFSSSDPSATLPANYTFVPGDNGVHTFTNGVTLYVAGSQTVMATQVGSPGINGSVNHTVNPGPVFYYYIYPGSELTTSVQVNMPLDIYILPFDLYFNWITNYAGTISFFSPDPLSSVPADYTFTGLEGGIGVPGTVTFGTLGSQELYVWDTATVTAFGYAAYNVTVVPGGGAPSGGQPPGAGDAADLLAAAARPAATRLDRHPLPPLAVDNLDQLFARPDPIAYQEAWPRLIQHRQLAPAAEWWSPTILEEILRAV